MNNFNDIKIAVAGTGYVGLSIATLLAQHHPVTAVYVIERVEKLNNCISPIQDDYIEDKLWNNIFAFPKDGNLPIDNNLAERTIRPLTTQRNAMLHFGSDEGVEMAATYHSIISTVKMQGKSAWEYLGKFFTKIFNGCKDFISLRPGNIGLATCQHFR